MTTSTTASHRQPRRPLRPRVAIAVAALVGGAGLLTACGSSGGSAPASPAPAVSSPAAGSGQPAATDGQVLPVDSNPIVNTATAQTLSIDSVLVENNVDATGKAAPDHLEISVSNTGTTALTGFEVYYTFTDSTDNLSESYYAKLPSDFSVAPGASRVIHFDDTGAPDHFPVNSYSLYYTDTNALDVSVEVSAVGAAPQTAQVKKDAGGAETAD